MPNAPDHRVMTVPKHLRYPTLAVALALAIATSGLVMPSTGGASVRGDKTPVPIATLVARSHKEGGLTIYGNPPAPYFNPVITAFEHQYPWINVQYSDLGDNQVFSKYESEHAQGAQSADLLIASAPTLWVQAARNGVIRNVTPLGLANFPSFARQGSGLYVMSPEPILSAYNEKLLQPSEVPHTYAQLAQDVKANPSKFKLVSYPVTNPLAYGAIYGLIHILGAKTTWQYLSSLGPNTKTFDAGLDGLQYMLQGGASIGYISSGLAQGVLQNFQGLANYVFMQDATPLVPRGIAVTQGSGSPASAQLFLDFVFSAAGQQALCAAGFEASQNNFVPTNGCTASLTQLYKSVPASRVFLVPFTQDVLRQQAAITARWNAAFHR
jgi:iron(III) transport system substrate-binding protein